MLRSSARKCLSTTNSSYVTHSLSSSSSCGANNSILASRSRPGSRRRAHELVQLQTSHNTTAASATTTTTTKTNDEHREAMRLFVETLQRQLFSKQWQRPTATTTTTSMSPQDHVTRTSTNVTLPALQASFEEVIKQQEKEGNEADVSLAAISTSDTTLPQEEASKEAIADDASLTAESTTMDAEDANTMNLDQIVQEFESMIRRGQASRAYHFFYRTVHKKKNNITLPSNILVQLVQLVAKRDALKAYKLLKVYKEQEPTDDSNDILDLYRWVVHAVGRMTPRPHDSGIEPLHKFIRSLRQDLDDLYSSSHTNNGTRAAVIQLHAKLVDALAGQRHMALGPHAGKLFRRMVDLDMPMSAGWLRKWLNQSRYNRQDDLPYGEILERLVALTTGSSKEDCPPHPLTTLPVVLHMFPYGDTAATSRVLDCLVRLSSHKHNTTAHQYYSQPLDRATLQAMASAGAHAGDTRLVSQVWDVYDLYGYPSDAVLWESTSVALALEGSLLEALKMVQLQREAGFDIELALIRSLSRAVRSNWILLKRTSNLLWNNSHDTHHSYLRTIESINILLSCHAERGDAEITMKILNKMEDTLGVSPNQDSLSFVMESLGKDIHRRKKSRNRSFVVPNLQSADALLTKAEDSGMPLSGHLVHNYVELLLLADEVDTATSVVEQCVEQRRNLVTVEDKTMYRVALANAECGNMDTAKTVSSWMTEYVPALYRKIKSLGQRHRHLERVQKGRQQREQQQQGTTITTSVEEESTKE